MFRYEDGRDITEEEYLLYILPFEDKCHDYLEKEVLPEYVAYYLATGVRMKALWQDSFRIHIQSAASMFNMDYSYETLKAKITDILYNKYKLRAISEDPLNFEKVS